MHTCRLSSQKRPCVEISGLDPWTHASKIPRSAAGSYAGSRRPLNRESFDAKVFDGAPPPAVHHLTEAEMNALVLGVLTAAALAVPAHAQPQNTAFAVSRTIGTGSLLSASRTDLRSHSIARRFAHPCRLHPITRTRRCRACPVPFVVDRTMGPLGADLAPSLHAHPHHIYGLHVPRLRVPTRLPIQLHEPRPVHNTSEWRSDVRQCASAGRPPR